MGVLVLKGSHARNSQQLSQAVVGAGVPVFFACIKELKGKSASAWCISRP